MPRRGLWKIAASRKLPPDMLVHFGRVRCTELRGQRAVLAGAAIGSDALEELEPLREMSEPVVHVDCRLGAGEVAARARQLGGLFRGRWRHGRNRLTRRTATGFGDRAILGACPAALPRAPSA